MHNHILNARVAGNQRSFHLMACAVSLADRHGGINLNMQFDEVAFKRDKLSALSDLPP